MLYKVADFFSKRSRVYTFVCVPLHNLDYFSVACLTDIIFSISYNQLLSLVIWTTLQNFSFYVLLLSSFVLYVKEYEMLLVLHKADLIQFKVYRYELTIYVSIEL